MNYPHFNPFLGDFPQNNNNGYNNNGYNNNGYNNNAYQNNLPYIFGQNNNNAHIIGNNNNANNVNNGFTVDQSGDTLTYRGRTIQLMDHGYGDITRAQGVIVNAAKPSLTGGHGVDGAIHRAARGKLKHECEKKLKKLHKKKLGTTETLVTKSYIGGVLNIIHTVGPNCQKHGVNVRKRQQLFDTYSNCLRKADAKHLGNTINFPAISTGSYKFPKGAAARISLKAMKVFFDSHPHSNVRTVRLYARGEDYHEYRALFQNVVQNGLDCTRRG